MMNVTDSVDEALDVMQFYPIARSLQSADAIEFKSSTVQDPVDATQRRAEGLPLNRSPLRARQDNDVWAGLLAVAAGAAAAVSGPMF